MCIYIYICIYMYIHIYIYIYSIIPSSPSDCSPSFLGPLKRALRKPREPDGNGCSFWALLPKRQKGGGAVWAKSGRLAQYYYHMILFMYGLYYHFDNLGVEKSQTKLSLCV